MTLSDVGTYDVAYKAYGIITGLILVINTLFLPLIVEYRYKRRYDLIRKYLVKIPLFSLGWAALVAVGLLFSKYAISVLFSSKYINSIPPFNILLIGTIIVFISTCLTPIINAYDYIIYHQLINLVMAAINLALDFILIPKIGIIGGAYATVTALIVSFILKGILVFIKRKEILEVLELNCIFEQLTFHPFNINDIKEYFPK
jgi:stage V sporulation protein B